MGRPSRAAASTRPSRRSKLTRPHSVTFDAIGTGWQIDTAEPIAPELRESIAQRLGEFDRTWSRFRDDSLVARIATTAGSYTFPSEAGALFDLYRGLYEATDAAVSPLVGAALERLGYDRAYSLRPSGPPIAAPSWDDAVAWDGSQLTTLQPVVLDVGAAGKGLLVDLVSELLIAAGHTEAIVDGSGDIRSIGSDPIRVALEHPLDTSKAIGIANVRDGAICSSATNRRGWGDGLHHVIDATTGRPTANVIATWAIADTAMVADGISTALFFTEPARLAGRYEFTYVRMFSTGRVEFSPHLDGEIFT